ADVDELDAWVARKRIEVDDDEVVRLDVVLLQRRDVLREVAPREDPRVDARMECLHAPAQHLRHLDRGRVEPKLAQEALCRAAGRHELDAEVGELAGEHLEPGLVVDGDHRSHSSLTTFGRSSCSAALTRSRSVSAVSPGRTGTRSAAITGPVSTPSST